MERKITKELPKLKELNEIIVNTMNDAVWMLDLNKKTTFVNPYFEKLTGYSPEEVLGREVFDFFDKKNQEKLKAELKKRMEGESSIYELEITAKDGKKIPVMVSGTPLYEDGEIRGMFAVITDLTERKKLEQQLKEYSEQLERKVEERTKEIEETKGYLASILDGSADAIVSVDLDGIIKSWNRGAEHMLGYTSEEIIGEHYYKIVPKELQGEIEVKRREAIEKGFVRNYETYRLHKDGRAIPVNLTITAIKDFYGKVIGTSGVFKDISERKKLEREIVDSKKYLEHVIQTMPSGLFTVDTDIKITSWNRAAELITGYKKDEVIGKPCIFESSPQCGGVCRLFDAKEPIFDRDYEIVAKDGEKKVLRKNTELLIDAEGDIVGGVESFIDVTRRKKAEEELKQRVEELERWHKLTIGRESRMIELKKRMKDLEEEIERLKAERG